MTNYKYHLQRKGKKLICPNCGFKGKFVPYLNTDNQIVDGTKYGRCERINTCGYILYPEKTGDSEQYERGKNKVLPPIETPSYIPPELVESTLCKFETNIFFLWLVKIFGDEVAKLLQVRYNIGTAKGGGTIFWQQDKAGNYRTGKVMYYTTNGKRDKNHNSWYLHNKVSENYVLKQVFFGEHLITTGSSIALCESEKTAIVMSVFNPELIWLAAGGSEMLNAYRLTRIPSLSIVYPDNGMRDKWTAKTNFLNPLIDNSVDAAVVSGELPAGSDILDLMLLTNRLTF